MSTLKEIGTDFFRTLLARARCYFNNIERSKGESGCYTSGRRNNGCLNGAITGEDLDSMLWAASNLGWVIDTIVMRPEVFFYLLRDEEFHDILLSKVAIVPTEFLEVDPVTKCAPVLAFNSHDPDQAFVAHGVKVKFDTKSNLLELNNE